MGRKRKAPGSAENERLEWLGDALLECAVSQLVVRALCQRRESSRVHLYACVREALLSNEALARVFLALRLDRAGGGTGEVKARADVVEALAAHLFLELSERQDSEVRLDALLEAICDGGARVAAQSYRGSAKRSDASCRFTPIGRVGNDFGILESVQDVASDTDVSESDENACVADILREKAWEEAERAKLPAQRAADDRRYMRAPRTAAAPAADSVADAPERVETHAQRDAAVASALNEPTVEVPSVIRRLREQWGVEWSPPATPRGMLCTSPGLEYAGPDASTLRRLGLASVAAGLSIALFMHSDNETKTPGELTVARQQLLSGLAEIANEELGTDLGPQLARETLLVAIGLMCALSTTLSVDDGAPRDTRATPTPTALCARTVERLLAGASQSCERPGLRVPFARLPKAQQAMARLLSPMLNKPGPVHQTEEPRLLRALERGSLSLEPLRPTVPPPKRKKRKSRKKRAASTCAEAESAECEISATLRRLRALDRNAQRTLERLAPTELLCNLEQRLLEFLASTNSSLRFPAADNFERLLVHLLCQCHALDSRSHDSYPGSGLRAVEVSASSGHAEGRRKPAFSVCRFLVETTTGMCSPAIADPG